MDTSISLFDEALTQRQTLASTIISKAILKNRLAPAYLLVGSGTDDKLMLARQVASFLNCTQKKSDLDFSGACRIQAEFSPRTEAAKICQNCRWISINEHPQALLSLGWDKTKSGKISVEEARALSQELAKTSQFVRVVVIENASSDIFHRPAANALLKTIEEPKAISLFFLFSKIVDEVIPTVVSRCQVVPVTASPAGVAENQAPKPSSHDFFTVSHCLEFSATLCEFISNSTSSIQEIYRILDDMVKSEAEGRRRSALSDRLVAGYIKALLALAEATKQQLGHYVSTKFAIESFMLSWHRLRAEIETKGSYS